MRTVFGSVALCVGVAAALATAFLALAWSQAMWLIAAWGVLATILLLASVFCLRAGPDPVPRRWLIVVPALTGALVGAVLAVLTSDSGTAAVTNDTHRLWVAVSRNPP